MRELDHSELEVVSGAGIKHDGKCTTVPKEVAGDFFKGYLGEALKQIWGSGGGGGGGKPDPWA